jgi:1-acyl-sn-glycerol-3-phosphate acyltransferase
MIPPLRPPRSERGARLALSLPDAPCDIPARSEATLVSYYKRGDELRLDLQDPRSIDRFGWTMKLMGRYFKYRVHGLENIPREGPALLALNHGPVPLDATLLGHRVYQEHGRLPRGLTDHLVFKLPGLREFLTAVGAVDGRHETADALLERGNLVIVMPGGAPEAFKPSSKAYQLYWLKRKGFAKLAIRQQVPVIPAACVGIDDLYTVPFDMFETGKRLFGVRSLPIGVLWGRGPGIPRRVPLTHWIGEPIHPDVPAEAAEDDDVVIAFRDRIVARMQQLLADGLKLRREGREPEESTHDVD